MIQLLLGADVLMIAAFILKFSRLPPQVPLYYSQPWGESQLADSWMIFFLLIFLNLLFFINQFLIASFTLIFIKIIFIVS